MPEKRSVVDIEIPDAAFKRVVELAEKYRAIMTETGSLWGDHSDIVGTLTAGFASLTEEMKRQSDEAKATLELEKERAKLAKEQTDEAKRQATAEKEAQQRREKAIRDTQQIAKNVADTAVGIAKWAAIDMAGGVLAGAAGMWGLGAIASGVANQYRSAAGYGVSTGAQQGLQVNMQRYFDVNSTLSNIANAQNDPNQWWRFAAMGVSPQGKDPAQLSLEMYQRAIQIYRQDKGNTLDPQLQSAMQFYSLEDIRRGVSAPPGQLRQSMNDARNMQAYGLSADTSQRWTNFMVGLDQATTEIQNKFVVALTGLTGPLTHVVEAFTTLALDVLNKTNLDAIAQGINGLAQYLGSKQFQTDFGIFVTNMDYAAHKMVALAQQLGFLPAKEGPDTGYLTAPPWANAPPPMEQGGYNSIYGDNPHAGGGYWETDRDGKLRWFPDRDAADIARARNWAGTQIGLVGRSVPAGGGTLARIHAAMVAAEHHTSATTPAGGGALGLTTISDGSGHTFTVSAAYAAQFLGLVKDLEAAGYPVREIEGYNSRYIAGTHTWSKHAFGQAIHINPDPHRTRRALPEISAALAEAIAARHGLTWGGVWGDPDTEHFEVPSGSHARRSNHALAGINLGVYIGNQTGASVTQTVNAAAGG